RVPKHHAYPHQKHLQQARRDQPSGSGPPSRGTQFILTITAPTTPSQSPICRPYARFFSLPHNLPLHKSPHQPPHLVMPSHHIILYLLSRSKERLQRRRDSSIERKMHEAQNECNTRIN